MQSLYRPLIYRFGGTRSSINELKINHPEAIILDTISDQLHELYKVRNPKVHTVEQNELNNFINQELGDLEVEDYGTWVYYPWKNTLVHLLNEREFFEVRTNRNNNKISFDEQQLLKEKTIGIIGLSVGQSVAITIAMERVCGRLRLADFDTIELSNLNRIRTSVCNLGLSKAVIVAREIAEIDPYFDVEIFEQGLTNDNMLDFFQKDNMKLDLLVELCDGLDMKLKSRLAARDLSIPVLMETNDRCMIDIERFDLDSNREILHGLVSAEDLIDLDNLTGQQRLSLVLKIVDQKNLSAKMKVAFDEMGKTIRSWPQLASSVTMGGGIVTDIARRILLDEPCHSGRWYFDIDELLTREPVNFE